MVLHGTHLAYVSSVTFGGKSALFHITSPTTITVLTPTGTRTTTVTVSVSWPTGTSNTVQYRYNAPRPTLSSITPTEGLATGGTDATLHGTNLTAVTSVTFGGTAVTIESKTATTVTIVVPPGPAGTTVTVTVTSSGGTSTPVSFYYTYPTPSLTSIQPTSGPSNGGTKVLLRGAHLEYVTSVTFGGTPATFTIFGPTSIYVTVPPGTPTTTVDVYVTSHGNTSNRVQFTYTYPTPTLRTLTPSTGPASGGNTVTIHGANLKFVTTVYFGTSTTSITSTTTTSITVTAPPGTGGNTVTVSVTSPVGRTYGLSYTYEVPGPSLTSVSPSTGPSTGGTSVTLYGSNLTTVTTVIFGGQSASFTVQGSTSILVTVPPGTPTTTVTVSVTSPQGGSNSVSYHYIYPTPSLRTLTPSTGPASGETNVTIDGTNLQYVTAVYFGTNSGTITFQTTTSITVTVPPGTGGTTVTVSVTSPVGRTYGLSYTYKIPAPSLTSASPHTGPSTGGTTITLYGSNLTTVTYVTFGGYAASFTVQGSTSIRVTVPAGTPATTVTVSVTSPQGQSNSVQYHYSYPTPTLSSITPSTGPASGGNTVNIWGKNLQYVTAVYFGTTTASIEFQTPTLIAVTAPAGTGGNTVTVSVTSPVGRTFGLSYTYEAPPPSLTSLTPSTGPSTGGTTVTLHGSNLTTVTAVTFGGTSATFTVQGPTSIRVTVPPGTPTTSVSVFVRSPNGTSNIVTYAYRYPTPTLSSITPSTGPAGGGNAVTITGENLRYVTTVYFGTTSAPIISQTTTSITVTAPAGPGGQTVTVTVTSPVGPTYGLTYTYLYPTPSLTSITPSTGPASGGTTVTIHGANLTTVTYVTFGGTPAFFFVDGPTAINVIVPPGSPTSTVTVWVDSPGGQSNTVTYSYYATTTGFPTTGGATT